MLIILNTFLTQNINKQSNERFMNFAEKNFLAFLISNTGSM